MEKKYCAAPWRGLHINFRGDVKTCCAGDPNILGDLNSQNLNNIIHSDRMQEIRSSISRGVLHPEYCYNCIQAERNGSSERNWHNSVSPEFDASVAKVNEHVPTLIDVRWNITCNLSCNYCGPFCSSKWASRKKEFVDNGIKSYHTQVVEYIITHKEHVREVALVGGEPLLLKENIPLIEALPDDCLITVITNTNVDFESNQIFQALSKKTNVGWSLSFDNVEEKFEYVRHGGKWELLLKNINLVKNLIKNQGHHGGIHSVYNIYNCTKLQELKQFGIDHDIAVFWQTLFQPSYLAVSNHNQQIRQLAIKEIESLENNFTLNESEKGFFNSVKNELSRVILTDNTALSDLREHIHLMETLYHTDQKGQFAKLWPELFEMIK